MGDKSPKSTSKRNNQKQVKNTREDKKKREAEEARRPLPTRK